MKLNRKKMDRAIAARGLSRYQLLDILGISEATFYRWLRQEDAPPIAVAALCYVLGTTEKNLTGKA